MSLNWHSTISAVISVVLILLGGHALAEAARVFVGGEFVNELPGVAFAGFPPLYASIERLTGHIGKRRKDADPPVLRSWVITGLSAGAIMVAFTQFLSGLLGIGLLLYEAVLEDGGVAPSVIDAIPVFEKLGVLILPLMPIVLMLWIYFGARIHATTRSRVALAAILAVVSYTAINFALTALTPVARDSMFPQGKFDLSTMAGAASVGIVLPLIGLIIGIFISWSRDGRTIAGIAALVRKLSPEKRREVRQAFFEITIRNGKAHGDDIPAG
jgi:hypothetical protein